MVNRTRIITLTVQHNTMHHRKVLPIPSPLSTASVRKKLISAPPVNTENNNVVVNTILCRVQLSNKRHPQISSTLEQAPHLRREKFSAAAFIRVNTVIKVSACEIILA